MNWIKSNEQVPPIDTNDKWNAEHGISKDVRCYSPSYGQRNGRYFHSANFWQMDGVTSSEGVKVTHWMPNPENPI